MYNEENEYDSENDHDQYAELTSDILKEIQYDKKIDIINFYKELLSKEPEFIGIKNICSGKILDLLDNINNLNVSLNKYDYQLNI